MAGSELNSNMGSENQSQLPLTEPLSPLVPQRDMNASPNECETLRLEVSRLSSALEKEQACRQRLEHECALERQKAEGYYLDRQDYKQRLREAASAYAQLKDAYRRLRTSPLTNNNPNPTTTTTAAATVIAAMTSIDATEELEEDEQLEGSPTQDMIEDKQNTGAPLLTQHIIPQPVVLNNNPNVVKKEEEDEKIQKLDEEPTTNAIKEQPSSYSPCHRPAWKKAVRRRGDGLDNDDIDQKEDDDDIFLQPQAKKWAPDRSTERPAILGQQQVRAAQPRIPSFPPPRPPAEPVVTREQQQQLDQSDRPKGVAVFKHQQVIRKKEDREKLEGFECQDCKRFYDALEKWGAVAIGGLPQCQHRGNVDREDGGDARAAAQQQQQQQQQAHQANMRNDLRAGASRHRYLFEPPLTPQGFWDLGFDVPVENPNTKIEKTAPPLPPPPQPTSAPDSFG